MGHWRRLSAGAAIAILCAAGRVDAATVTFTTLASWQAAVGASSIETFDSFAADASFLSGAVALNGMSVTGTAGANGATTQKIDVAPLEATGFYDQNGTAHLLGEVIAGNFLRFDFANPLTAWSIETKGIGDDGRPTTISIYDAGNNLLGSILTSSDATSAEMQFYGFQLTGGDLASYVILTNASGFNDVFSIENVRFASDAVPEPATLLLLGSGLAAVAARRRNRNRS
jgi:hypothetical protein